MKFSKVRNYKVLGYTMRFNIFILILLVVVTSGSFFIQAQDLEFVWAKRAGGSSNHNRSDRGNDIAIDGSGDIVIIGDFSYTADFNGTTVAAVGNDGRGHADVFVAKYDIEGNLKWIQHAGGWGNVTPGAGISDWNSGYAITTDTQNNIIATGSYVGSITFGSITLPSGGANSEMFLVKYDPCGKVLWAKAGTGSYHCMGWGVATDHMDNVIVVGLFAHHNYGGNITLDGITLNTFGGGDIFIAKYDPNGNLLWARQAGSSQVGETDYAFDIMTDNIGNIVITGRFTGTADFGGISLHCVGYRDIFLAKYDSNGNVLWAKQAGGATHDCGSDIAIDPAGNITITGWFSGTSYFDNIELSSAGYWDIFVARYNSDGNLIWAKQAGGNTFNDVGFGVTLDNSGNSFVTGYFNGICDFGGITLISEGGPDIFIAKYDVEGNVLWAKRAGGVEAGEFSDRGQGIALDGSGNIFVTGQFSGTADFSGITLTSTGLVDFFIAKLRFHNHPPTASAGVDIFINSDQQSSTIIQGTATDEDPNDILQYRWKEGGTVLENWTTVGENGECLLNLKDISIGIGTHTLTIEITDGEYTSTDDMTLVIRNSPPHLSPGGEGVFEINTEVIIGGYVSDFDGDILSYQWLEGTVVLLSSTIQAVAGGTPVKLPDHSISNLSLGIHTIILRVDDNNNDPTNGEITVEIVDTTAPTLAPAVNKTVLWPPNHKMVDITIEANATDNSGLPVILSAFISSSEPIEGSSKGDKSPDWTEPLINQENGVITFQLRAERLGKGSGRVYTVAITATDTCNNSHTENIEIIVPHDKKKK